MGFRANGILAAILGCILLLGFSRLFAHGGGTPRLTDEPVGPYRLYAWSSPEPLRAGVVHMTFAVVLPPESEQAVDESSLFNDLDQVVTGADIDVTFTPVSPSVSAAEDGVIETVVVKAQPSAINPLYYEVDTELPIGGEWQITIDVAGNLGSGFTSLAVPVEAAHLLDWRIVAGVVALLFFIILIGRAISWQSVTKQSVSGRRTA